MFKAFLFISMFGIYPNLQINRYSNYNFCRFSTQRHEGHKDYTKKRAKALRGHKVRTKQKVNEVLLYQLCPNAKNQSSEDSTFLDSSPKTVAV